MMQISIIIPSYKPGEYVFECLDSIMDQTLDISLFEVIVVLNGPRDPYFEKLNEYAKKHGNVQIVYEQQGGVSNARNVGMGKATGTYFCFIDDDDIVSPNYLEELLKISTPTVVGVSNIHSFTNTIADYGNDFFACKVIQRHSHPNSLVKNRAILSFPVAKLLHRDMIGGRLFDVRFANGEDVVFMTQISDRITGFAFTLHTACYFVRKREGSATRRKTSGWKLLKHLCAVISALFTIYFSNPSSYDLRLFLIRIPGIIKGGLWRYFKNK